ncbi:hypothetical protein EOA79_04510 [Mesorhizobium sp. M1A.F.Ca.IN.020.03.2.1]|nr:hypothetical protein EOA79_04510 [Mesorhizobium sp. M1A.F.Ca.IN.020.03.2.1]
MTKLSDLGPPIVGRRFPKEPSDERDHFHKCGACGQTIDLRDLRQVIWHERPGHEQLEMDS